jgi:hypothetical protein
MKKSGLFIVCLALFFGSALAMAAALDRGQIDNIIRTDSARVFGNQRENLYKNNSLLREAIPLFLESRDEAQIRRGGFVFVDGCRVHSCIEKGAAAVDEESRRLVGTALLSFNCRLVVVDAAYARMMEEKKMTPGRTKCDESPSLKVFLIRYGNSLKQLSDEAKVLEDFRTWAKQYGYVGESVQIWESR